MAQLSDDCFAFGGPMMSVDEAVGLIATRVTPVVDVETVTLARADGRILAHDVQAPLPLPPFTNSAVDGYAVASRDLPKTEAQSFPVIGRVQAGSVASAPICSCVVIVPAEGTAVVRCPQRVGSSASDSAAAVQAAAAALVSIAVAGLGAVHVNT